VLHGVEITPAFLHDVRTTHVQVCATGLDGLELCVTATFVLRCFCANLWR